MTSGGRCCATEARVSLPDLSFSVRGGRSTGSRRFVFRSPLSVTTTLLVWLLDAGVRFPFVGGVPFFCSISVDLVFRFFLLCSRSSGFSIFCFRVWCFYGSCVPFIFIYLFLFLDLCRLPCSWVAQWVVAPPLSLRWLRVRWGVVVVFGVGNVVFGDGDTWRW
jgi:hypothetical protein